MYPALVPVSAHLVHYEYREEVTCGTPNPYLLSIGK